MRRLLFVLGSLLLGSCTPSSGSGAALGDPCSHSIACDSDGVCDYEAAMPVCIDKTADNDGDGIPNAIDHCPDSPGGLYDEDNDGLGDECDKCPIAPPPATPDPDGDDVDSPCDPDPLTPGDKILFFDGFGSNVLNPMFKPTGSASWTPIGGELEADAEGSTEEYLELLVQPVPSFAIETAYRIESINSGSTEHKVVVRGYDSSPAGVASFECGVVTADVGSDEVVALETNLNGTSSEAMQPAFSTEPLYESGAYATNANVGCTVIGDNMVVGTTQGAISPASLGTGALGIWAITARFQWVLVVGRPTSTGSASPQ
ncbi:MAG TPA: hypothetical protein VGL61_01035 [Kofleriaceae bacterium]